MKLKAREELRAPSLADLSQLDDTAFRALFSKSPVKRIGRDRFVRNVLIAIGNSGDADADAACRRACSTTRARWCAAPPPGRWRNCCRTMPSAISRDPGSRGKTDPAVREELTLAH